VSKVVRTHVVGADEIEPYLRPRDDLVVERPESDGEFALESGPFYRYHRSVRVERAADGGPATITESLAYRLAIPIWGFLFELPVRRYLGRPRAPGSETPPRHPWWAPPDQLDVRATVGLSLLCVFSVFSGYMGTLLSQTNTYFKQDFGVSDGAIGVMLAATRVGALLALMIVALADRRGRRFVLIGSAVVGAGLTATGALAPNLFWLGVSQTLARAFSTALVLVISIIAVEEMPAGSRAFAVSVLTATAALGAGMAVMLLPVTKLGVWAWRILYVVPLIVIPAALALGRHVPETERFERHRDRADTGARTGNGAAASDGSHRAGDRATRSPVARRRLRWPRWLTTAALEGMDRGRLVLLAVAGFLLALFVLPASSFLNDYLRTTRGFSATSIVVFQLVTSTPGGIGIVVGGRLADRRGRRLIGSIGVALGTGATVLMFLFGGPAMWIWSLLGTVLGAMAVPALAVYGPELFPTDSRGTANGLINLFSVLGSASGLALAGWLSDHTGGLGPAMAILAIGPAAVVVLILVRFPETASIPLEELNPTDVGMAAASVAAGLGDGPFGRELLEFDGMAPIDVSSEAAPTAPPPTPPRSPAPRPDQ
jgi:MFS family permease